MQKGAAVKVDKTIRPAAPFTIPSTSLLRCICVTDELMKEGTFCVTACGEIRNV